MLTVVVIKRLALLPLLAAGPAIAEPQAYRLSQAEIDATIAAASYRHESQALLPPMPATPLLATPLSLPNLPPADDFPMAPDRKVHGTAGFAVSSDGGYALFGSAAVPIGETSYASFSFSYSRIPQGYFLPYGGLSPALPNFRR
jgi:hypothetical protein